MLIGTEKLSPFPILPFHLPPPNLTFTLVLSSANSEIWLALLSFGKMESLSHAVVELCSIWLEST